MVVYVKEKEEIKEIYNKAQSNILREVNIF
jgi:hypothetical protein